MKGFILSLDALMALGFAVLFLSALSQVPHQDFTAGLRLQRQAADLTVLLDKQDALAGLASADGDEARAVLNATVSELTEADLAARLEVKVFSPASGSCSGGCQLAGNTPQDGFCLCAWHNSSEPAGNGTRGVFSRMAYVQEPERMALVQAWVWKR